MKIFCIGTWKTGTTSIGKALHKLMKGKHQGFSRSNRLKYFNNKLNELYEISRNKTTFDDTPWNCIDVWPTLKEMYPTSKFVLTIREENSWFNSMIRWYDGNLNTFRHSHIVKEVYRRQLSPFGYDINKMALLSDSKQMWIGWYRARNKQIVESFNGTNRLLIYNIDNHQGWPVLCTFLNKEIPLEPFPHLNKNKKI